jgi:hypothetical protein
MTKKVTINLVTEDPHAGEWVLHLVEDGPWPEELHGMNARLRTIQDRVYGAVDVALEGQLARMYPEARGARVRVQVDSPSGCPDGLQRMVNALHKYINETPGYLQEMGPSHDTESLRVVTGHQLGKWA